MPESYVTNHTEKGDISISEDVVTVDVAIMVRYGYGVTVTAKKIQEQAAASVESMTGLAVRVNVHVTGIAFDKADMKG